MTLEESGLGPGRLLAGLAAATLLFGLVFGAIVEAGNVSGRLRVLTIYTFQDAARPKATTIKTESPAGALAAAPPSAAERALDSKASSEGGDPTVYRLHETEADRREQVMRALTLLDLNGDGWIDRDERSEFAAERWETLLLSAPTDDQGRVALADLRHLASIRINR